MKSSDRISCRSVLWCLVFVGAGVNYMIRTNINIAIVAMVWNKESVRENTTQVSECYIPDVSQDHTTPSDFSNLSDIDEARLKETLYDWDENQQANVLGGFYWLYWSSQIPGGVLSQRFGFKVVFGFSILFLCVSTFFIPLMATLGFLPLVVLRVVQGVVGGTSWPSLHVAAANWIPPQERSKFMSAVMGSSFGAALTYPLCGLIIYYLGWQAVFYVTGAIGVVWFIAWWLLVFNTPYDHPRISEREFKYIENSLNGAVTRKKLPIPWMKILTSIPVWLTISVSWGCLWGMFTLLIQAPTYFQYVHGWSIRMNGLLSGVPHVCRVIFCLVLSFTCDTLLERNIISPLSVRKISAAFCCLLHGLFLLGLAFSGCSSLTAIICLTMALAVTGAESPGPLANYVDLAPNYAGVVMGFANMITVMPGFISPLIVGTLTYQNQTSSQWQTVFIIAAAMALIPSFLFLCFGTNDVQSWNGTSEPTTEEMQDLKSKNVEKGLELNKDAS